MALRWPLDEPPSVQVVKRELALTPVSLLQVEPGPSVGKEEMQRQEAETSRRFQSLAPP